MAALAEAGSAPTWPFQDLQQGFNVLPIGNPIIHTSYFSRDGSYYMINQTVVGHWFHTGAVVSRVYQRGNQVLLSSHGFGYGSSRLTWIENHLAGLLLFGAWWQGHVAGAAKIHTGQIDPRALK